MIPAAARARLRGDRRLLAIDPTQQAHADHRVDDLPRLLAKGDLLVVNDSATLPASLHGVAPGGEAIELRLLGQAQPAADCARWRAVLFGAGDWRTDTLKRPAPPRLARGDGIRLGGELAGTIEAVSEHSPRLVVIRFDRGGAALWAALYRIGKPIQYAYLDDALALDTMQTGYAARPWSVEPPSAGLGLSWSLIGALAEAGVETVTLTHAAGLSSTGDATLDALLPLPERYEIPEATVAAITRTRRRGRRVIAVGTTVVRALEACQRRHGQLRAGEGIAALRIDADTRVAVVDGLLSGLHDPGASHHQLLQAFADGELLDVAWGHALERGYVAHELGDVCLIAPELLKTGARVGDRRRRPGPGPVSGRALTSRYA